MILDGSVVVLRLDIKNTIIVNKCIYSISTPKYIFFYKVSKVFIKFYKLNNLVI